MLNTILRLLKDRQGTSAIEYGMICAAIVLGIIASLRGVADEDTSMWSLISSRQAEATQGAINN